MPTSTINHTQVRSTIPGPTPYQVQDTVNSAVNIDKSVFTFETATSTFNHVATVLDMLTYPDSHAAAVTASLPYYRQFVVTKSYALVTEAQAFATMLIARMSSLAREYDLVTTAFVGTTGPENLPQP
jgi:hypothetical protein